MLQIDFVGIVHFIVNDSSIRNQKSSTYLQRDKIKMNVRKEKIIFTQVLEIGNVYSQYTCLPVQPGNILLPISKTLGKNLRILVFRLQ